MRGHRIEIGEIETALLKLEDVKEAAVVASEDSKGEKSLVAYVVPSTRPDPDINQLRTALMKTLPDYMVPSTFVMLEQLPMSPNGKLDRRALSVHHPSSPSKMPFAAPRTSEEETLARIWAETLGLEKVGIHDNFFELGGHSLQAMQLIHRISNSFQLRIPLRSLAESPTVESLASHIKKGKEQSQDSAFHLPEITPAPDQRNRPFPLTEVQQAYLIGRGDFLELGQVSTHRYTEIESVDMDLERLAAAWRRLIEHHDMLRAVVLPDGQQQILEQVPPYEIKVLDLRGRDPETIESELKDIRQRMSHQVLPSDRWPLFEIRATRLDEHRTRLHLSFDALTLDGRSRMLLFDQWAQLYEDPNATLPPQDISFRDYVLAENRLRDTSLYQSSKAYWQERLSTLPAPPDLPLAKKPSSIAYPKFVRRSARLEHDAWRQLRDRANKVGLTSSGVLLAAFGDTLKVWSKSPRFTINLTFFNRLPLHPQVEDIAGDFTSLSLLEVDSEIQGTFGERARRVQQQLWDDLEHRYFGGVAVQRELAKTQERAPAVAAPVVFTSLLSHTPRAINSNPMAWMGKVGYTVTQTPQVWLDHQVLEEDGDLVFNWDAVDELFPQGFLDEMFDSYCRFLHRLANDDGSWQEDWWETARQLVPTTQLAQRASINATKSSSPESLMLHTLVADQVTQRPNQAAVIAPNRTLSYEELDRRSNRLARHLRRSGAHPNKLVAIVMEKGWEQVVAVLAILKSGAAYLPIDPELPKERFLHLLEHGGVKLALTQSWINDRHAWPEGVQQTCVDTDEDELEGLEEPLAPVQGSKDLAYVIYTSGSTGLPKGVMIDHRGAVNTILDMNHRFGVGPHDRVLALSSLGFDLSVYDIFGTLAAGGTVIMPEASEAKDPAHWAELVNRQGVTIWNSVPTLMKLLLEYVNGRSDLAPHSLRLVLLSGDWIPLTLPDQIRALVSNVQVISLGGATEASIWSILYPIEKIDPSWKSIPYGKPMTDQSFHVLNAELEPCPVWVPGELYIGGIGLAKGYWKDEEKTGTSFITHPRSGERLYRTGDLGRYLPDGNIEFLGREDLQVKIEGFRVELGEIEAALSQHPEVGRAIVSAIGDPKGRRRLVAHVEPAPGQAPAADELRSFLQQKLPYYMVPSVFVLHDQMPLSSNGKVDRRALPDPADLESLQQARLRKTSTKDRITVLVEGVLGTNDIDESTDLLHLGATSLDIVRIANMMESELGFRPKLGDVYRSPTITGLVQAFERYLDRADATARQAVDREPGEPYQIRTQVSDENRVDREEGEILTTVELLDLLRSKGVELWADGNRLSYSAPKGALTPFLRRELTDRKSEILEVLREANATTNSASSKLQPISRDGALPLSFAQERQWLLAQLEPDNPAYVIVRAFRITGSLDTSSLEKSLNEIVRRHGVLRTTCSNVQGQPIQTLHEWNDKPLMAIVDLRDIGETEKDAEIRRLLAEESRCPFDLSKGPMLRSTLIWLNKEEYVLILTTDHFVADGRSMEILWNEISTLYKSFSSGLPSPLPEITLQYADLAHYERQKLQGEEIEAQITYWKRQLADLPELLNLPSDRPRPPVQTHNGATQPFELSDGLSEAIRNLSHREGVTIFMTLLAALQTLLHRYTQQSDIFIGTAVSNRNRIEAEGLIGSFSNNLVLRTDFSGNPTFRELLARVREVAVGAYSNQDVPIDKLVQELTLTRDLSRNALFQVLFILHGAGEKELNLEGLKVCKLPVDKETSRFDFNIDMVDQEGKLWGLVEYNTDLFDKARIARMIGHFQTLLRGIVNAPEQLVSELPLLSDAESRQLLRDWNETKSNYPSDKTLHGLFEDQVRKTPSAIAVEFEGQELTYAELNSRANQLAHRLQALGVGPEVITGICMEPSLDMIIGIIGILKAGGSYLPLNPGHPKRRLTLLIEDAKVPVIVTNRSSLEKLPSCETNVICLDLLRDDILKESCDNPDSKTTPESSAYVVYTSGSTGAPKGVVGLHRGAVNRLSWMWQNFPFESGEVCCQITSLDFVDSVWEIFGPLLQGIKLVVVPKAVVKDPRRLVKSLSDSNVTRIVLVPSLLRAILDSNQDINRRLPNLKFWVTTGETLSPDLCLRFHELLSNRLLLNLYGSTEVSADVTYYDTSNFSEALKNVPIGRPISNTKIYILDHNLKPVPVGVPGELCVGGDGLARGYINRSDLTAEKFISNPFTNEPSAHLYKTGDLARYLPDGNIEYLGRIDHQINLRGFRIEPSEIEAALCQHPAISEAVVSARGEGPYDKHLVAHIVPYQDPPTVSDLRTFLKQQLPEHMVPSALVMMDGFQVKSNGKVDFLALPVPDAKKLPVDVAPRTPTESLMARIWCRELGLERIGIYDNFFELGGHSLLAVRLFNEISKAFDIDLPLATLFRAPTIVELARIISANGWSSSWSSLVAINPSGPKPPLFIVHGGGGHVLYFHELAKLLGSDQPVYGLQSQGLDGQTPPHTSVESMASHYIKEIRTVQPKGPYFLAGGSMGGTFAFEMAHNLQAEGEEVALLALIDSHMPGFIGKRRRNPSISERYRVNFHIDNMKYLGLKQKLTYIIERLINIRRRVSHNIWVKTREGAFKFYQFIGQPLPRAFRDVHSANSRALKMYSPKPYSGHVVLFRASEGFPGCQCGPDLGWSTVTNEGLEIREVPGSHTGIYRDPNVQVLAQELKASLSDAQARHKEYSHEAIPQTHPS